MATILGSSTVFGQKRVKIKAIARGTSTQLGTIINIDLIINEFSPMEERNALVEAFKDDGSAGLAHALDKLRSKGRIAITGTLGYDVNFVRSVELADGSRLIRFVTDRPLTFAETWASSRSSDYQITLGEIIIRKGKGKEKSEGTLYPAAMVRLNKQNEIEIESFRNPWKLTNISVY
jgi:hypothetical protein